MEVRYPKQDGTELVIPPGDTSIGPWDIRYDPFEEPQLDDIPAEVELWFTDSPTEFAGGSITFGVGRLLLGDYVQIYDELD